MLKCIPGTRCSLGGAALLPLGLPALSTELRAGGWGQGPSPVAASVTGGGEALGAGAPIWLFKRGCTTVTEPSEHSTPCRDWGLFKFKLAL